jgi:acyl-CoA synthetase (NDP forming)
MMGSLMSRGHGRGIGFSRLVSVGNESDLSVGEITGMLVDDPHTEVILLFMETIRDADHLSAAAHRAAAAGKPIVVYKLGRSEVGRDLAASHTGAMTGSDEAADAFFRAHGMLRVDQLEALFELPALVRGRKPASRHRVAVMTTTGGGAAAVAARRRRRRSRGPLGARRCRSRLEERHHQSGAHHRPHAGRCEEGDLRRRARKSSRTRTHTRRTRI